MTEGSREERVMRLRQLALDNPNWGRRRLAGELRKEFGKALRMTEVSRLKEESLLLAKIPFKKRYGKKTVEGLHKAGLLPKEVADIGFDETYHRLRSSGFLDMEIRRLLSAMGAPLVFREKSFENMMRERRKWAWDLRKRGWTNQQIRNKILEYYTIKPGHSPFDFLRDTYGKMLAKLKDLIVYDEAARARSQAKADIKKGQKARRETKALYAGAKRR